MTDMSRWGQSSRDGRRRSGAPQARGRKPSLHQRIVVAAVGAAVLVGCQLPAGVGQPISDAGYPIQPRADALTGPVPVSRVVDGDTLWVQTSNGDTKVRLIGVDTPELLDPNSPVECFAQQASDYTKSQLAGQMVYLEDDDSQDSVDRYGRRLAYVWTLDGRLINLNLIAEGYAKEYTYSTPYRYQRSFKAAERAATQAGRGLWSPTTCAAQG